MRYGILVSLVLASVAVAASPAATLDRNIEAARVQVLKGNFASAANLLEQVHSQLPRGLSRAGAKYELELGRLLMTQGNVGGSVAHFQNALAMAKASRSDAQAVDAQVMLAITSTSPADQLAGSRAALQLATGSKDPAARSWVATIWNNIGATEDESGRHKEALAAFQKSRAACRDPGCARIADWKIAHVKRELGQTAEAKAMLEGLERRWKTARDPAPAFDTGDGVSYVYQELGEVHMAMAASNPRAAALHRKAADAYFAKAYAAIPKRAKVAPLLIDSARISELRARAR